MRVRSARVTDGPRICELINHYAEQGHMLHRSLESAYDDVRDFQVAEDQSAAVVGCIALDVVWSDLAEIRSFAVDPQRRGTGVGPILAQAAVDDARRLGVRKVFVLTYETGFFEKLGFRTIDRQTLPEKIWRACVACPKADACDEIAMQLELDS